MKKIIKIDIYSKGLIHCSICAPKKTTKKDIEYAVNFMNPTGVDSQWHVSRSNFISGELNPSPCERDKGRVHYLMLC